MILTESRLHRRADGIIMTRTENQLHREVVMEIVMETLYQKMSIVQG